MIQKYKKRPVVVEAVEWTGDNLDEIKSFVGKRIVAETYVDDEVTEFTIEGINGGWYYARIGDMIVKIEDGNFRVMNHEWFKKNYDKCYTVDE